jgi:SRSO17 transposase
MPKLQRFLDNFKTIFRRSDTMRSAERYITGLLSDIPYKNCGMIAEYVESTSAQALQELLTNSPWDYEQLNAQRVQLMVERAIRGDGAIIIDDTGFTKDGKCSVGVSRQYSGTLGKIGNCQIAVSLQYMDCMYSWPVNARLYLPEKWTSDEDRMKKAKVPEDITFKTKAQIALDLLDQANALGVKHSIVLSDSFYGKDVTFLEGLEARQEAYAVSVPFDFTVLLQADLRDNTFGAKPGKPGLPAYCTVESLRVKLPESHWKTICWRDGAKGKLQKQFAFIRACWPTKSKLGQQGWIIFERPVPGSTGELKYYFSNLPIETPDIKLVEYIHRRHAIERFYQDAKDELGLDQYEGRRWHGFHRHVAMVMLAYSWLALQRKVTGTVVHHYEVEVDNPVAISPSLSCKGVFSP